uniref:AlNc14C306G10444 protein n=1 Tax=Albugo laibachii Nc14 TaxID=890382 RepID=F0WVY3_9STRA|nr:AlNc14C306G10444 [Albugo laibachii Nc14]|eukprot:CCA25585.1 AlNc14C306G10444 [Albugo laibachii Nc14]
MVIKFSDLHRIFSSDRVGESTAFLSTRTRVDTPQPSHEDIYLHALIGYKRALRKKRRLLQAEGTGT